MIAPPDNRIKVNRIALIDADTIKYRVLATLGQNKIEKLIERNVSYLAELFNAKQMLFCFSGPGSKNFRHTIAVDRKYKGNRDNVADPQASLVKAQVVGYIKDRYPSLMFKELEADDLLGMLQDDDTFIYSEDKDLKQVPGRHWDIKRRMFVDITEEEANSFFMKQMLTGDTVDNIGGVNGIGKMKAEKLITEDLSMNDWLEVVLGVYVEKKGLMIGLDMFVENYMLLRMRMNRGEYFQKKYKLAFDTLETLKQNL